MIAAVALGLAACGGDPEPTKTGVTPPVEDHPHTGTHHDLGTVEVGAHRLAVTMIGDVKPDAEVVVEVTAEEAVSAKALRMWIGDAAATGALKSKSMFDAKGSSHAHIETSETVPEGAKLWLSIEENDGSVVTASIDLPAPEGD